MPKPTADRILAAAGLDRNLGERRLQEFIAKNEASRETSTQDEVGRARLHLGYLAAKRRDFRAARAVFQATAKNYRGEGRMTEDYGGIPDQATYQAAVCLVALGKNEAAAHEFRRMIRDQPLSPMVTAAFRRLVRLNGGSADPADGKLLQTAIEKQQARLRFETSVCGPKAIARLLQLLNRPAPDYHEIAKLCGTTQQGTTMAGMRKGLDALGLPSRGYELNRKDFARLTPPFLLLSEDHYVVVTALRGNLALTYDPRSNMDGRFRLPTESDLDFRAAVLTVGDFSLGEAR